MDKSLPNDLSTKLVHSGEEEKILGAVVPPIFQSANFVSGDEETYEDVRYARLHNTPNHLQLHRKLAAIEDAEAAVVLSSGMAAITSIFFALLKPGDHILIQSNIYGGTFALLMNELQRFGISHDFVDPTSTELWKAKPNTRLVYVESISNPLMEVPEFSQIIAFAKRAGLITVIDNTFATPVNFQPLKLGFDLVLHSATKYLNGHSDIIAGCVMGKKDLIKSVNDTATRLGGSLDTHACFLLNRGLKTLALRMERHNDNALQVARFLDSHPKVRKVNYPGLEAQPSFDRARRYFNGFGGMLSFELKDEGKVERVLNRFQIAIHAASLGGVESLVVRPARTSHASLSPEERRRVGISDGLIRMSVGIESVEDLIADLDQAMD